MNRRPFVLGWLDAWLKRIGWLAPERSRLQAARERLVRIEQRRAATVVQ